MSCLATIIRTMVRKWSYSFTPYIFFSLFLSLPPNQKFYVDLYEKTTNLQHYSCSNVIDLTARTQGRRSSPPHECVLWDTAGDRCCSCSLNWLVYGLQSPASNKDTTRTLGARCAPYHLSKQLNISISKVMKCDNWHAWYMIIIQHKITAYSNNTSLIC
jgi:hypothetical protein